MNLRATNRRISFISTGREKQDATSEKRCDHIYSSNYTHKAWYVVGQRYVQLSSI